MGINLSINDEKYMRLAMAQAHKAEQMGEVPVGAVVVYQNQVIASAHNQVIGLNDPTAHAEILALKQAGQSLGNYRLVDCDLFVTLEPCTMCAGSLVHSRINRVVFGAFDRKTGVLESVDNLCDKTYHNHQVKVTGNVLGKECGQLLSDFFSRRRKAKKSSHCE